MKPAPEPQCGTRHGDAVRHLVTSSPTVEQCPRCSRLRLVGLADGVPYRVEPVPLHAHAELRALVDGRCTWTVIAGRLAWRSPERIRGDARRGRPVVFADHRCGQLADPADVDPAHVSAVAGLLCSLADNSGFSSPEIAAFTALANQLGARVVADSDEPPF